ncbi:DnaA/Hda family protein [Botrimarina colliarenosi]|uniref:DnaA/Hda family protein n=1 Tax=Botrimarina colliarenosi TaxID=2528001 RepID=UPI0018D2D030|nr:DnaA/Hda family protein [Botrimarina colliarenosi]
MVRSHEACRQDERTAGDSFRDALRQQIGATRYSTWFAESAFAEGVHVAAGTVGIAVSFDRGAADPTVTLTTASSFEQSLLRRQFRVEVEAAAHAAFGPAAQVAFEVQTLTAQPAPTNSTKQAAATKPTADCPATSAIPSPAEPIPAKTSPSPTKPIARSAPRPVDPLEGWVVGESNAPATRLCQRLIAGDFVASPVLLWGPSGVGKSHLLRAVAEGVRSRHRRRRVLLITAEQFLRGFVDAARGGGFPSFRQKHQGADLLLVDDVQQLIGKTRTLEEFRQTIDAAIEAGAQVVMTADRGLNELRELGPEIASRLAGGLAVETPLPDALIREGLVRQAAERVGLDLPEATARALACRLVGGGREAQGAVNRMALIHDTFASALDEALAIRVADDANRLSTPPVRLADIQRAVCGVCGVDLKMLRSDKRTKSVTEPRMLAMWLSRKMTGSAWSEIGEYYGRSSHSTVIAAHRRVETLLAKGEPTRLVSGDLGETIRRIEAALRSA